MLPKNYSRLELTPATLGGLIDLFSNEDLAAREHQSLDVLRRIFEYMLSKSANAEGKLGGEFFTHADAWTMLDLIDEMSCFNAARLGELRSKTTDGRG